ncbi:MAG TPA: ABC transporter permease [Jiangellaceae bacterium]|nr:ABC transporter permease [Jiangellaceae bacterium]
MSLALTHTKYETIETFRIPIAVVGSVFFPAAAMLFFVVPNVGGMPEAATLATGSMVTFAAMITCLFNYGAGIAERRATPWDPYVRTLPAGAGPRFAGMVLTSLIMIVLAVVPVTLIGALLTEATVTPAQFVLGLGALLLAVVPFTLMGLAIGYSLPTKAALAVANIAFFPLAFGSGMFGDPRNMPGFVEAIAPYLPTRGAAELVWGALGQFSPNPVSLVMFGVWVVVLGLLAAWAYRRDEGRRFS